MQCACLSAKLVNFDWDDVTISLYVLVVSDSYNMRQICRCTHSNRTPLNLIHQVTMWWLTPHNPFLPVWAAWCRPIHGYRSVIWVTRPSESIQYQASARVLPFTNEYKHHPFRPTRVHNTTRVRIHAITPTWQQVSNYYQCQLGDSQARRIGDGRGCRGGLGTGRSDWQSLVVVRPVYTVM